MATAMIRRRGNRRASMPSEGGFSLLEVVISMAILTVGLVSLLGVFGLAMASTQSSQVDMIAKQLANEAMESIVTARNTSQLNWDDIQNAGSTNCPNTGASTCGIFANGLQPMYKATTSAGTTGSCSTTVGILGTTCDVGQAEQTIEEPGPDGQYGDTDDVILPLTNYQRTILIGAVTAGGSTVTSLRSVTITVQYAGQAGLTKTYVLNSFISQYR